MNEDSCHINLGAKPEESKWRRDKEQGLGEQRLTAVDTNGKKSKREKYIN